MMDKKWMRCSAIKKNIILILSLVFFLTPLKVCAQATQQQSQLDDLFTTAIESYNQDQPQQAASLFGQILTNDASLEVLELRAACYFWRGCARYGLNDYSNARDDLQRALQIMEERWLKTDEYFYCPYLIGLCDYRRSEFSDIGLLRQAEDEFERAFEGITQYMSSKPLPDFRKRLLRPLLEQSVLYAIDSKLHRGMLESEQPLREALDLCSKLEELAPADINVLMALQVIKAEIYLQLSKCCSYAIQNRDRSKAQADSALQIIDDILQAGQQVISVPFLRYLKALCCLHLGILGDVNFLQVTETILNQLAALPDWWSEVNLRRGHANLVRGDYGNSVGHYNNAASATRGYWKSWAPFLNKDFTQSASDFEQFINMHANTHDRRTRILVNDARFRLVESKYFACAVCPSMQAIIPQVQNDWAVDDFPNYLPQCERSIFSPDIEMVAKRRRQFEWICGPQPFPPPCDTEHIEFGKEFLKRGMAGCGALDVQWAQQTFQACLIESIARLLYAITLFAQGNPGQAIGELHNVLDPNLADERDYTLGRIYESTHQYNQALQRFQSLSNNGSICATFWMMSCHFHLHQFVEAVRDYWTIRNTVDRRGTSYECATAWLFWQQKAEELLPDVVDQFQMANPGSNLNVQQYRGQPPLGQDNTSKAQQSCYFLLDNLYYDETLLECYRQQLLDILAAFDDPFRTLNLEAAVGHSIPTRIPDAWFDLKINFPSDINVSQIPTEPFIFILNSDTLENIQQVQPYRFAKDGLQRGQFSELMIYKKGFYPMDLLYKFYIGVEDAIVLEKAIKYELEEEIEIPNLRWIYDIDNSSPDYFYICGGGGFYRYDTNWSNEVFYPLPDKSLLGISSYQDAVYCADVAGDSVIRMSLTGTKLKRDRAIEISRPADICCHLGAGGIQYLYVVESDSNRVLKYTAGLGPAGDRRNINYNGRTYQMESPDGIWVTPGHVIYVADCGNHRVLRFDNEGRIHPFKFGKKLWIGREDRMPADTTEAGGYKDGEFYLPLRVVVGQDGYIFVSDLSGRIQKFDADGNFLQVIRSGAPVGMAIDGDVLYVVDKKCDQIKVLVGQWNREYEYSP